LGALSIQRTFGGLPFLDDAFDARRLLTAVIAFRAHRCGIEEANQIGVDARLLLSPRVARELMSTAQSPNIRSRPLWTDGQEAVDDALASIRRRVPAWAPLLDLPVEFRELQVPGPISCSCYSWPQHVFLAPEAFASSLELTEQILHELDHNWIYLIEEVVPLHPPTAQARFVLPSGTGNRTVAEVIGAGCVAAMLLRWYDGHPDPRAREREHYLTSYLDGCLTILRALPNGDLTEAGAEVRASLDTQITSWLSSRAQ